MYPVVPLFGFFFLEIIMPSSSLSCLTRRSILKLLLVREGRAEGRLSEKLRGRAGVGFTPTLGPLDGGAAAMSTPDTAGVANSSEFCDLCT